MRPARSEGRESSADPTKGTWLACALAATALTLTALWVAATGDPTVSLPVLAFLLLATHAADRISFPLSERGWYTAATPMVVFAALLGGPAVGAVAGALSAATDTEGAWRRRLAHGGLEALRGFAAGLAGLLPLAGVTGSFVRAALATAAAFAVQLAGRALIFRVRRLRSFGLGLAADGTEALFAVPVLALVTESYRRDGGLLPFVAVASILAGLAVVVRAYRRGQDRYAVEWRLARTDPGTGLPNRRAFEEALRREHARVLRGGRPAGLFLLDLDRFKAINDGWSYATGNRVLHEVGERITAAVRRTDIVARWGGEEFVVLAPTITDVDEAEALAHKLCRAVSLEPVTVAADTLGVTASVGATLLDPRLTSEESFREANDALKQAKLTRDRAVVFDGARCREQAARLTLDASYEYV